MAPPSRAELSSLSTALDELAGRITGSAEELLEAGQDGPATELFEVERSLRSAQRRLTRLLDGLAAG